MELTIDQLANIKTAGIVKPGKVIFELPEKVLQFGTGVLLRGLPDYFIDKANRQGIFKGRVVVVKSTDSGDAGAFDRQGSLYTLCVRGIEGGKKVEENIINSSISRVLSARGQWQEILQCARSVDLQVIVSNTTEVGIQLVQEDIRNQPPASFPGKLLALLYERFRALGDRPESGLIIVPTELIPDNGKKLAAIVRELAEFNKLEAGFFSWMEKECRFCSSLVDRIVPGRPKGEALASLEQELGYADGLLSISEVYRLWAIEGDERVRSVLSFAAADPGVIIQKDIDIYRELKLRLLNGTHTLSCGLACLAGFGTVKSAMEDAEFSGFVSNLMLKEIAPSIPYELSLQEAREFGLKVLDRFRNPYIEHQWISITMQYTSKMRMRNIPVLLRHYERGDSVPELFALGFAAYLLFMRPVRKEGEVWQGEYGGQYYPINDDKAGMYAGWWKGRGVGEAAGEVAGVALREEALWGTDLSKLKGFEAAVKEKLDTIINKGVIAALAQSRVSLASL